MLGAVILPSFQTTHFTDYLPKVIIKVIPQAVLHVQASSYVSCCLGFIVCASQCDSLITLNGSLASRGQYLSRGQVLDAARERILKLEKEIERATAIKDGLLSDLACFRQAQESGFGNWPVQ